MPKHAIINWINDDDTEVHETTHASKFASKPKVFQYLSKFNPIKIDPKNYYTHPEEVYSRIMTMRYDYRLNPGDIVSDFKNKAYSRAYNELKEYYNDQQILEMLNTLP